jgi:hypothetical protein
VIAFEPRSGSDTIAAPSPAAVVSLGVVALDSDAEPVPPSALVVGVAVLAVEVSTAASFAGPHPVTSIHANARLMSPGEARMIPASMQRLAWPRSFTACGRPWERPIPRVRRSLAESVAPGVTAAE